MGDLMYIYAIVIIITLLEIKLDQNFCELVGMVFWQDFHTAQQNPPYKHEHSSFQIQHTQIRKLQKTSFWCDVHGIQNEYLIRWWTFTPIKLKATPSSHTVHKKKMVEPDTVTVAGWLTAAGFQACSSIPLRVDTVYCVRGSGLKRTQT